MSLSAPSPPQNVSLMLHNLMADPIHVNMYAYVQCWTLVQSKYRGRVWPAAYGCWMQPMSCLNATCLR